MMHKCTFGVSIYDCENKILRLELHTGTSILSTRVQIRNYLPKTAVIVQIIMVGSDALAQRARNKDLWPNDAGKLSQVAQSLIKESRDRNFDILDVRDFVTLTGEFSGTKML